MSQIENPDNPSFKTPDGNKTKDWVFCLSVDEVKHYLPSDEKRKASPTAAAKNRGLYLGEKTGCADWWLRSPGSSSRSAAGVNTGGSVIEDGWGVNIDFVGVRPALYIDLPLD